MSVTFNNVQELEEYFRYLEETIHDDERRLVPVSYTHLTLPTT